MEQRERVRAIERKQKRIIPDVFVHVGEGQRQGKRIQRRATVRLARTWPYVPSRPWWQRRLPK